MEKVSPRTFIAATSVSCIPGSVDPARSKRFFGEIIGCEGLVSRENRLETHKLSPSELII